jgi:peptidoglycan hydrolase CwlO-like protein
VKRLENLLAECQASLEKSDSKVLRLQTSLTEKGDEFEKIEELKSEKYVLEGKLKRQEDSYEREQAKWVRGGLISSSNSNIWCRMRTRSELKAC